MRRVQILFWLAFAIFSSFHAPLAAQTCPDPQNLSIVIDNSSPPVANVSWSVPPGSGVIGYTLVYSINGGAPVTVNLPPSPTAYSVSLPRAWETLDVSLTSICDNGGSSRTVGIRTTNIIIIDVVMRDASLQQTVCTEPCAKSTHFYYGTRGSGLKESDQEARALAQKWAGDKKIAEPPAKNETPFNAYETFRNSLFCNCMSNNGNDYSNQTSINACHFVAREYLDATLYNLTPCSSIGREKPADNTTLAQTDWYLECTPNPIQDQLLIKSQQTEEQTPYNYLIMNTNGQIIAKGEDISGDHTINTSLWASGLYFVKASAKNGLQKAFRLIKI